MTVWLAHYWWLFIILFGIGLIAWIFWPRGDDPQPPSPQPPPAPLLAITIQHANNMQAYWIGNITEYPIPIEGGVIHKIDAPTALKECNALKAAVLKPSPMHVACALIHSESDMDPGCVNRNLNKSNPSDDPWGWDCGAPQLKLKDITINGKAGQAAFATWQDAQAFAFDVDRAIPYFWGLYQSHLATADTLISSNRRSDIDPRLMNRYCLAAIMYKQGTKGGSDIFFAGTWPNELNNFYKLLTWWAQMLGENAVV